MVNLLKIIYNKYIFFANYNFKQKSCEKFVFVLLVIKIGLIYFEDYKDLVGKLSIVATVTGIMDEIIWLIAIQIGKIATSNKFKVEKLKSQPCYIKLSQLFDTITIVLEIVILYLEPTTYRYIVTPILFLIFLYVTYLRFKYFIFPCK